MKLYVYDHCPFCVRARMIFGLKGTPVDVIYLANDDEQTPIGLIGKKMLPVTVDDVGHAIGESLDIVKNIDNIDGQSVLTRPKLNGVEEWIETYSSIIYKLAIPRWAYSNFPEFQTISARQYFINKKQAVFGSFSALIDDSEILIAQINQALLTLEHLLDSESTHHKWSPDVILLYPVLRSLSIVKGIVWPNNVDRWRKNIAGECGIALHDDIAL